MMLREEYAPDAYHWMILLQILFHNGKRRFFSPDRKAASRQRGFHFINRDIEIYFQLFEGSGARCGRMRRSK